MEILHYVGDVNPIEHGGGIIFKNEYDEYYLEYTEGINEDNEVMVYQVEIAENVYDEHNWIDVDDVSDFVGYETELFENMCKSQNIVDRVYCLIDIASYYGFFEMDQYPKTYNEKDLIDRWKLEE